MSAYTDTLLRIKPEVKPRLAGAGRKLEFESMRKLTIAEAQTRTLAVERQTTESREIIRRKNEDDVKTHCLKGMKKANSSKLIFCIWK